MFQANNVRVIDGDTIKADIDLGFNIWMHDQTIRLAGIDTPELKSKDPLCAAAALLAKKRVVELVNDKPIRITSQHKKRDKFGRVLATIVSHDDVDVNQTLLSERLAVDYSGKLKTVDLHLDNINYLIETKKLETV